MTAAPLDTKHRIVHRVFFTTERVPSWEDDE
jgi:hypothetical protein